MTRNLDEKHQKILRQLLTEPGNKQCMDCKQKGPVYANLTHGTFVCTTCSGLHREFSHRVKSISMATFTPEEIVKMQEGGNDKARQHWRANWNPEDFPVPDSADQEGLRRFIRSTYIDKRWIAGGGGGSNPGSGKEKRTPTRAAAGSTGSTTKHKASPSPKMESDLPAPEPLSNILGADIPKLNVADDRQIHNRPSSKQVSHATPTPATNGHSSSNSSGNLIDLLGPDFPMSTPSQPAPNPMYGGGGFMNPSPMASQPVSNPFGGGNPGGGLASLNPSLFAAPAPAPVAAPGGYNPAFAGGGGAGGFNPFAGLAPAPAPAPNPLAQQQATPQQIVAVLNSMGIVNPQVQMNIVQQMQFMHAAQQQQFIAQLRLQLLQQQQALQPPQQMFGGGPAAPPATDPFAGLNSLGGARSAPSNQGAFF